MASNIWFSSDTHWGHSNILKYCNRPFNSVQEMDEVLIENWNKVVREKDTVYHLGDFSFRNQDEYIRRLRGRELHFIMGNHDKKAISNIWLTVSKLKEIRIDKQSITLCHYAMRVWNKSHHGAFHLYGHSHSTLEGEPWGKSMDVGVDNAAKLGLGYRPFNYDEVKEILDSRQIKSIDHHKGADLE